MYARCACMDGVRFLRRAKDVRHLADGLNVLSEASDMHFSFSFAIHHDDTNNLHVSYLVSEDIC